jgi:uncharacterized damage-inducible protein DinB
MDILERLLAHDAWTTRQVLLLCQGLSDEQLDRDFDIGHRTLRATWAHLIGNLQVWTDLMAEREVPRTGQAPTWAASPATLLAAWEAAMADFTALARDLAAAGRLDDSYTDTLDDPPRRKTFGGTIAHLLTHDMHHRGEILHILQRLGVPNLPEGDVLGWEAAIRQQPAS